jgi:hypothetical protein
LLCFACSFTREIGAFLHTCILSAPRSSKCSLVFSMILLVVDVMWCERHTSIRILIDMLCIRHRSHADTSFTRTPVSSMMRTTHWRHVLSVSRILSEHLMTVLRYSHHTPHTTHHGHTPLALHAAMTTRLTTANRIMILIAGTSLTSNTRHTSGQRPFERTYHLFVCSFVRLCCFAPQLPSLSSSCIAVGQRAVRRRV